jgi:bifunctional UDP-N-acetylglucosamine pyrophosphorylase / glucosamine-1-phosphate N-acetyltransferase
MSKAVAGTLTNAPLHVVILAAGKGTRMHSARAKVLQPLAGKPMLAHVIALAQHAQAARIHVVYGHQAEQVRAAFANTELNWVLQAAQNGTGHAVQLAMPDIPDDARVLVLYGDAPALSMATLQRLLAMPDLAVLVSNTAQPGSLGRMILDAGKVQAIVEAKDASAAQLEITTINTGMLIAPAADLRRWLAKLQPNNQQKELYLTDIFAFAAAESRPASAVYTSDYTEGMGANDAWELAQLERYVQLRLVRELCAKGLRVADPARVELRGQIVCGQDVELDVGVILEGTVHLADGCKIGPYTRIKDSTLGPGTQIASHCDVDGLTTAGDCQIGPFARIRAGTQLAKGCKIGNFVETKKAQLGAHSKASHLSYLGDAVIGQDVNIGAGTITCNYDGVNKFVTEIADGVFVGSNTALVAPVKLAKNTTIGAGSVITKNAPEGGLTLTRSEQKHIAGWKRKPAIKTR